MKIALYGLPFIVFGLAFGIAGLAFILKGMAAGWVLAVPGFVFAMFCAFFFRDPSRELPSDPARIFSPGDGRVLTVRKEEGVEGETIRIFLSVFNVHIQRMPVAGSVEKIQYKPGTFALAMKKEAESNERNIVTIKPEGRSGNIVVEQIAGWVARRIRWWVKEGQAVAAGEKYGLIQFGSQAAVHLPKGARPLVKPGDKVTGGITAIAEWIEEN